MKTLQPSNRRDLLMLTFATALIVGVALVPSVSAKLAARTITADRIAFGAISGAEIASDSISSNHIVAGTIQASDIAANAIQATHISAGSIDATKLNVTSLSSVSSDLGTVLAGSISLNSGAFTVSSLGALYSDHATFGPSDTNVEFLKVNDGASFTGGAYVGHGEVHACFTNVGQLYPCS